MARALFVAGTDTGIGKTWVTAALVRGLRARGLHAGGMKPVASGCMTTPAGWRNDDALALLAASGLADENYSQVNPVALPLPASPHIAAAAAGVRVSLAAIEHAFVDLGRLRSPLLVEGVGGWSVPLSGPDQGWCMQADLVRRLDLPVLLVVGLRLGCINHALLSARAITADGCRLLGWIGNEIEPGWSQLDAVQATLDERLSAPCLGQIRFGAQAPPDLLQALVDRMA